MNIYPGKRIPELPPAARIFIHIQEDNLRLQRTERPSTVHDKTKSFDFAYVFVPL